MKSWVFCLLLLQLHPCRTVADVIPEIDTSYCGRRFRILFHVSEPFTIVDQTLCTPSPFTRDTTTLKCPAKAFRGDGGLTYDMMTSHLAGILTGYCVANGAPESKIEFDWYVIRNNPRSEDAVLSMMCNGGFLANDTVTNVTAANPFCPSLSSYKGPSPNGTCNHVGDPACVSRGPDIVAGAIRLTRSW